MQIESQYYRIIGNKIVAALEKRNMGGFYVENKEAAKQKALSLIPQGSTVIIVGSMTVEEIGLKENIFKSGRYKIIDPYEKGVGGEEKNERRRSGLLADVLICSTNAITLCGQLINKDGIGNRVAGMIFGPQKVIVVAGLNKVVANVEEGIARIERLAAPLNNIRLKKNNPCVKTGICEDCSSQERICNSTVILERQTLADRLHVILVGEKLGY